MKWTPNDVLKMMALIGGFIFLGVGIYLITKDISIDGKLDIKSNLLSGSIETGSAGLFISFFSLLIIFLALLSPQSKDVSNQPIENSAKAKTKRIALALKTLGVVTIISTIASSFGAGVGFGVLATYTGIVFAITGIVYLTFLDAE